MGRFKEEGNILVSNQSKNVLVNYNFMLRVEGIYDLPCKAVHSFTKENEFEYVQEGGLNDYVHMLRKPVSKPFSFTVERYVGMDIIPPLPLGAELVLPVILMVAPNANQFGNAKRTFVFTGCTVMSKTFGELNAEKSELLTETIVIGYREMTEVTVPVHAGSDGKLWKFDGINVDGNSQKSAKSMPDNGSPELRQWIVTETEDSEEGTAPKKVESAKKYTDIFKQEKEQQKAENEGTVEEKKPRVKPAPDTGEAKVITTGRKESKDTGAAELRQWMVIGDGEDKEGTEGKRVESAKKYTDIFKQEKEQQKAENEGTVEEKKPRVKPAPDTGEAKVITTGRKESKDTGKAKVITSGRKESKDTGKAKVRRWPPTKSAKTITDLKEDTAESTE